MKNTIISLAAILPPLLLTVAGAQPLYDEPHRPQFHFTPERNWMNDPNGLVFHDGEYHLFYQYNPFGDTWGHMSWGHAVSTDLLHWKHLPVALAEENGIMIFSGSAVVDHANTSGFGTKDNPPLIAIYTGHTDKRQNQHIAYSTDRGRTWTKYRNNPVIDENLKDFRDPKVMWHEPTKGWIMTIALPHEKKVRFYASPDLKTWQKLSEFGPAGATAGIWECPDLFEMPAYEEATRLDDKDKRWVLVVNINGGTPAGGSGCQYFVGQFDGATFTNDNPKDTTLWADYGADFYAAQSWTDAPPDVGDRVWIGWMSNWIYAHQEPTKPFRTAQSIPRALRLTKTPAGLRLLQSPLVDSLRAKSWKADEVTLTPDNPDALKHLNVNGDALEIIAAFENTDASEFGFKLRTGNNQETLVGYDASKRHFFIDRTRSGPNFHKAFPARHTAPYDPPPGQKFILHVLLDRSSVELFTNLPVITDRIFPDPQSNGFSAYAKGGHVKLKSIEVYKLKSVWN